MDKKRDPFATTVIDLLGGPAATARLFKIKMPSVSGWKKKGLPPARLMYLEVARPEILEQARKRLHKTVEPSGIESEDDVQPPVGTPPDHE
jgi:2'-5' RNA ligase